MKKRILTLLLAAITILQIIPAFTLPIIAEGEEGISVEDMEVGKLYSAVWDYEYEEYTHLYKEDPDEPGNLIEATDRFLKNSLPQNLTVKLMEEGDFFLYITNEDWPVTCYEYRYVDSYELIVLECLEPDQPEPDDGLVRGEVGLVMDGEVVNSLTIAQGEKTYVFTELSDKIEGTPSYSWQLLVDRESNSWADISGYVYPYAPVSNALVANAGFDNGTATLRCIATLESVRYVSGELQITVDDTKQATAFIPEYDAPAVQQTPEQAPTAASGSRATSLIEFSITVNYTYRHATAANKNLDTSTAANPHAIYRPAGGSYTGTITSPPVVGYLPYVTEDSINFLDDNAKKRSITYDGVEYYPANILHFVATSEDTTINVYYIPQTVQFVVKFYEQNLHDDEYVLAGTVIKEGLADAPLGEDHDDDRIGFTSLYYDPNEPISGDRSTELSIYYDRIYYLIKFNLNADGAYGATPYYVRYNSQVMLPSPTNPGYSFTSWTLNSVYTIKPDGSSLEADTQTKLAYDLKDSGKLITVQHNVNYTASWKVGTTSYTIAYWLEDPNYRDGVDPESQKYKIWGVKEVTGATAGSTVNGPQAKDVPTEWTTYTGVVKSEGNKTRSINDLNYLDFIKSDQNVVVKGDGSTVVNVYYDRKEYTLKFYYARSDGTGNDTKWYVAGQTDAGTSFVKTRENDDLKCLNNNNGQFGQVETQPTLKDGVADQKGYTLGTETYNNFTYYYLSFKAKYGADISDKYPCDVFNSVERTSSEYSNNWPDKTVLMSAWSGEYNVMFSQVDGNKTMKGKNQILDYRMLWDPSASGWNTTYNDNTVAYLAFWENAINVNWNVPELYRYKIWLEMLDGEEIGIAPTYTMTFNNVTVTYYLYDSYDTCDNSTVGEQTQPTIKGFTPSGSTDSGNVDNLIAANWTNQPYLTKEEITKIQDEIMPGTYKEAYIVNYFYTRNSAKLSFNNTYNPPESIPIKYKQSLKGYATKVPQYPSSVESGAMIFEGDLDADGVGDGTGWYIDANCTIAFSFDTVMGTENIQLYSKWKPTTHNIKVYRQESEVGSTVPGELLLDKTVKFGTQIQESELSAYAKPHENYIFGGWYYVDETGNEQRYDFNTMVIKHEIVIYAKWTSRVPVEYVVRYQTLENGVYVDIAAPTKGQSLAGISKSFTAKVETDLYEKYRKGCFPENLSHSMKMSTDSDDNTYTFYYSTPTTIEYTVRHTFVSDKFIEYIGTDTLTLDLITKIEAATAVSNQSALVTVLFKNGVTEDAIAGAAEKAIGKTLSEGAKYSLWMAVIEMSPDIFQQELILTTKPEQNVATFNWVGRGNVSIYQVIHRFQSLDNEKEYVAELPMEFVGNTGATAEATAVERYGFVCTDSDGKVSGKITQVTYSNGWQGGLVLNLYYDRVKYDYTIRYLNFNNEAIAAPKKVTGVPFGTIVNVSDIAPQTIPGYQLNNGDLSIEISKENQEIICYYKGLEVTYYYQVSGRIQGGSIDPITNEVVTVGNIPRSTNLTIEEGHILKRWYYTIGSSKEEIPVPEDWLSDDQLKISPAQVPPEWAGNSINIFAEILPTTLTISSFISERTNAGAPDWVLENQGFIYTIQGVGENEAYSLTVAVPAGTSETILGLPLGDYTITVENWSWRYEEKGKVYELSFDGNQDLQFEFAAPAADDTGYYYITNNSYNDTSIKEDADP